MNARRKFLEQSALLAAGGLLIPAFESNAFSIFKNSISPSDQVNIGAIGIKGMGWSNVMAALKIPGVNLVAVCDVDKSVIDKRLEELSKKNISTSNIKRYGDYRKLLEQKDIDAVIIGTPDHWHALMMIHACEAGKDVYVEKPVGNSIVECNRMVAAQKRYNKIVQAGQWQRSQQHFKDAVAFVHSGQLGNIRTAKVWCYQGWMKPGPVVPDSAPPEGVDYKQWLGPAKTRPFNSSRFHFNFRWFWDYAGGLMTDWGAHMIDIAQWGLSMDRNGPVEVIPASGDKPLTYRYANGVEMLITKFDEGRQGVKFLGEKGWIKVSRGNYDTSIADLQIGKEPDNFSFGAHHVDFIDCIRKRKDPIVPVEVGHSTCSACTIGNIAHELGRPLKWDPIAQVFTDAEANKKLHYTYQRGLSL